MLFLKLKSVHEESEVMVNAVQIAYISPYIHGGATISFVGGSATGVKETPEEVVRAIIQAVQGPSSQIAIPRLKL